MDITNSTPAGIRVNIIVLAFTLVSSLVVFLRLFTRLVISKMAGWEDAFIVLAKVFSVGLTVLTTEQVMNGLGNHSLGLSNSELDILLKSFWASVWVYNLTLTTIKVSIVVQYFRIFPVRCFRIACLIVLGLVVAYGAWAVSSSVLICTPIAFSWDKSIPGGRCMNQLTVWITNAALNITLDVVIFLMPLLVIRGLSISKSQKRGLGTMFILGASVTLVSIVRLYSLDAIANSKDVSFDNTDHAALSAVEVNVGIVCACLPGMRPLFALVLPQYFSESPRYLKYRTFKIDVAAERNKYPLYTTGPPTAHITRPSTAQTRPTTAQVRPHTAHTRPNTAQTRPHTAQTSLNTTPPQLISTPPRLVTMPPRSSAASSRSTTAESKAETTPPRANILNEDSWQETFPLQSIFSRPSGQGSLLSQTTPTSPPPSPYLPMFQGHSRQGSNTSVSSTASAALERCIARLQAGFDARRMTPISPLSTAFPAPLRIRKSPSLPPGSWMRRPSTLSQTGLKELEIDKKLPPTPFPFGSPE
ncbi:hypothetical protein J3E71DRAFT_222558 [Bipolaris maydis]|nr:hypothetical protein J3E71DRAFT_222558 [Bipolaris maydis]